MGTPAPTKDHFAADLRGFGWLGVLAILAIVLTGNVFVGKMVVVPVGALLVLLWAWRSRTPWRAIGYARPRTWIGTLTLVVALGIAFKFVMKAVVMPLLGADPINHAYHFLAGNRAMLPAAVWAMIVAGFGEETVFRGYLFERLGKLMGSGRSTRTSIVLLTSVLFGLQHYSNQGIAGVQQATPRRALVRNDLRNHRPDLAADGCARRVQPDCARDDLLESRIRRGSPDFQVGRECH